MEVAKQEERHIGGRGGGGKWDKQVGEDQAEGGGGKVGERKAGAGGKAGDGKTGGGQ